MTIGFLRTLSVLRMRLSATDAQSALWPRMRFDGELTVTPIAPSPPAPHYVYTNNYAMSGACVSAGADVRRVMSHTYADALLKDEKCRFAFLGPADTLSVTNKAPCSWMMLKQCFDSDLPKQALVHKVERYAASSLAFSSELAWLEAPIESARTLFREVLARQKE